ncbi:MAG: signal peptidase I [Clostridia bacterium]|nr:signal peptidase I [Clostridia bacterium]
MAFTFFFRLVQVEGESMLPTLYTEDKIIISNFLYTPDYGDIIAISKKGAKEESMIKRVIALPGDSVMIDFSSHIITVNGKVLFEDYEVTEPISEQYDLTYPVTVPDDAVFVLGDNRNNSIDSRSESVGFIKLDEINGKALIRLLPLGKINIY